MKTGGGGTKGKGRIRSLRRKGTRTISRDGTTLEMLTTSQKFAHRIAHELKKAFGGKTSYAWSDRDGPLNCCALR